MAGADVDMKLEVVTVPVSDVDRAKSFYQRLVTDFPDSPLRTEAQQKLASL